MTEEQIEKRFQELEERIYSLESENNDLSYKIYELEGKIDILNWR
jgi:hypothetical protein